MQHSNVTWIGPFLVALGGAVGAVLRWTALRCGKRYWPEKPVPTFLLNCIGSLALGFLSAAGGQDPLMILALGTGLLGGFTTFSTFAVESVILSRSRPGVAGGILYVSCTLIASAVLAGTGWLLGRFF